MQVVLFAGFGRAINAFRILRSLVPFEGAGPERPSAALRRRRGETLCRRIYGSAYGRLLARMREFHPDLAEWILEDGYGRVLARPRLEPRRRELLAVAALAALGLDLQLESHLRGARRLGARRSEIAAVLAAAGRPTRAGFPSGRRPGSFRSSSNTPRSRPPRG